MRLNKYVDVESDYYGLLIFIMMLILVIMMTIIISIIINITMIMIMKTSVMMMKMNFEDSIYNDDDYYDVEDGY